MKRIGAVAGKVVPAMAVIYVIISLIVIILHIDQLPRVLAWVVAEAFTPTAAEGGFAGATVMMAIRMGMARGVFSNEARPRYRAYGSRRRDQRFPAGAGFHRYA